MQLRTKCVKGSWDTLAEPGNPLNSQAAEASGSDHWWDLQPHRPEDGAARLAWKLLAQGRGRHSKTFRGMAERQPLLAPDPAVPFEQALEHLSARICRLHAQGSAYGVLLPHERIPAAEGSRQRERALAALASA